MPGNQNRDVNAMLEIDIAQKKVLAETEPLKPIVMPLESASGLNLAEDIFSDTDIPPFNRATMDGYAMRAEDSAVDAVLKVIGTVAASEFFDKTISQDQAVKIMTGAPVPDGCDTVIPLEWTSEPSPGLVKLASQIDRGKNIALKGEEIKKGACVLRMGMRIDPVVAAVLAQVGHAKVSIYPRPEVLILATGSELVELDITPKPGQIRDSNSYCILNQCSEWGGHCERHLIASDKIDNLESALKNAIDNQPEIIVITGGVSVGDYDLVPDVLKKLGANIIFHNVAQKPGKPMLFGTIGGILVFGLPGNPVAAYLCFELYIGPAIRRMMGDEHVKTTYFTAIAEEDFRVKSDRAYWHPAFVKRLENNLVAYPVSTHGSADIFSLVKANAFVRFEAGTYVVPAGEEIRFFVPRGKSIGT